MALSNLALFGGAFFTPVNIRSLLIITCYIWLKVHVGTCWKDHSYHRFVIHYILFSQTILISYGIRLAMVLLFDCNLRRCIATTHLSLRS